MLATRHKKRGLLHCLIDRGEVRERRKERGKGRGYCKGKGRQGIGEYGMRGERSIVFEVIKTAPREREVSKGRKEKESG